MVGKLNVTKNQYTKSITIPPVVTADAKADIPVSPPITEVRAQPTSQSSPTPQKVMKDNTNKTTVRQTEDESSITKQNQEVEFPEVSFENISFEVPDEVSTHDSLVLPDPVTVQGGEYTPISGVKPRSVYVPTDGDVLQETHSQSQGVYTYNGNDPKDVKLDGFSTNSGINIIVRGDNATITVSNNSEGTSKGQEGTLPTMKDIKNANSLEDLQRIEEKFTETLKYLEAKKLVLNIEGKLK